MVLFDTAKVINPFENDNARNSTVEDLPKQFVWTKTFGRLISQKNHIVLGARGSGKTAIVKMLSHEYLSRLDHPQAKQVIRSRKFVGIYVPMRLSWVGELKSSVWLNESEQELHFKWRLNVSCCASYLNTLRSCIDCYSGDVAERILTERAVAQKISKAWFEDESIFTIRELREKLSEIEYNKLVAEQRARVDLQVNPAAIGMAFELGLFDPLKRAIELTKQFIEFPADVAWAVCLDEAEYLSEFHHVILNSHLRTFADGLFFKITTMPYKHYTLETNTSVPLNRKDDFSYIYLDNLDVAARKSKGNEFEILEKFCEDIFNKRIKNSAWADSGVKLKSLLGSSYLLSSDEKIDHSRMLLLVDKHCNERTRLRARELQGTQRFEDEISRKLKGALLLRELRLTHRGNSNSVAFSGYEMVIRCADANPRRFISLLNAFYNGSGEGGGFKPISPAVQDKILRAYSYDEYKRMVYEPNQGQKVHDVLSLIGKYFQYCLHSQKLSTDMVLSFKFNVDDDNIWSVIADAVGLGLVRPIVERSGFDTLPVKSGVFRLSYILAPHFNLLPRRGDDVSLSSILSFGVDRGVERHIASPQLELL
ncbi:FunZ protein [Pseudomonas sp. IT-P74]|uniref:ORC-CDC6 family AAA ATPase n=1 Tax=Pseudomonas sp. IT-P74 TaxID=3026445 RepID=UPI0039E184C9